MKLTEHLAISSNVRAGDVYTLDAILLAVCIIFPRISSENLSSASIVNPFPASSLSEFSALSPLNFLHDKVHTLEHCKILAGLCTRHTPPQRGESGRLNSGRWKLVSQLCQRICIHRMSGIDLRPLSFATSPDSQNGGPSRIARGGTSEDITNVLNSQAPSRTAVDEPPYWGSQVCDNDETVSAAPVHHFAIGFTRER